MLLNRNYKGFMSNTLDKVKIWNNWVLEKCYKEKPKAKEDE